MTTNAKATHNGTCQACGHVQRLPGNLLAKHGYTVEWGFFNGTCGGSDRKPLEVEKTFTETIIAQLRETVAPKADKLAADLRAGAVQPKWRKGWKNDEVAREQLSEYEQSQCIAVRQSERNRKRATHAATRACWRR
jgi:hypothetical protein